MSICNEFVRCCTVAKGRASILGGWRGGNPNIPSRNGPATIKKDENIMGKKYQPTSRSAASKLAICLSAIRTMMQLRHCR